MSAYDPNDRTGKQYITTSLAMVRDKRISGDAKILYGVLAYHYGAPRQNRRCDPSLETLAAETGGSVAAVKRWLTELRHYGYIERTRGKGKPGATSVVTFLDPKAVKADEALGSNVSQVDSSVLDGTRLKSEPWHSSKVSRALFKKTEVENRRENTLYRNCVDQQKKCQVREINAEREPMKPNSNTAYKPNAIHDPLWFELQAAWAETEYTWSSKDWEDAYSFGWRCLDPGQKTLALQGIKDRVIVHDKTLSYPPKWFLEKRVWERSVNKPNARQEWENPYATARVGGPHPRNIL